MKKSFLFLSLLILSIVLAQEEPPSLDNHQFYGQVFWDVNQTPPKQVIVYTAKEKSSSPLEEINCSEKLCSAKYGYDPNNLFWVKGEEGEEIYLFLDEQLIGNFTYQPNAITEYNINLASESLEKEGCLPEWVCEEWSTCQEGKQTRVCQDINQCNLTQLEKTEEKECLEEKKEKLFCTQQWQCSSWSPCSNYQQTRVCQRVDHCEEELAQGKVDSIIEVPQPAEVQYCISSEETTSKVDTSKVEKGELELKKEIKKGETKEKKVFFLYLGGGFILIILVFLIYFFFLRKPLNKEAFEQLKEYYQKQEEAGLGQEEILQRLKEAGWSEKNLKKFLKKYKKV